MTVSFGALWIDEVEVDLAAGVCCLRVNVGSVKEA